MSRDHLKLGAFLEADRLVDTVYGYTTAFPPSERYGLQAQLRRAAVSAVSNIVEGAARETAREYCRFLNVAQASARECEYLLRLSARLKLGPLPPAESLAGEYSRLAACLLAVRRGIERSEGTLS